MSLPNDSSAPVSPEQSSMLRPAGQFRYWFTSIASWIKSLSPSGEPYTTDWYLTPSLGDVLSLDPDWTVSGFVASRSGFDIDIQMHIAYAGSADIVVPTTGNISNANIGTLVDGFQPRLTASLSSGAIGRLAVVAIGSSGSMQLAAVHGGADIKNGDTFTFQGMYRTAFRDRSI